MCIPICILDNVFSPSLPPFSLPSLPSPPLPSCRIEKIRRFSNNRFSVIPHEDLKPSVRRESRRLFSTSDDRSHLDNHAPLVAIGELSSLTEDRVSASTRDPSRILGNDEEEEEEEKTAPSEGGCVLWV